MKVWYLLSDYVSHYKAGMGNRLCLEKAGMQLIDDPSQADLVVIHNEPPTYPLYFQRYPFLKDKYVVAYAVWETDRLPRLYVEGLSRVDEIWTPSSYTEQTLKQYFENVVRIPHLVCKQSPQTDEINKVKKMIAYEDDIFYFYTIVDALNPRKNLRAALSAFDRISSQYEGRVRLVVKQYARIDKAIGRLPGVISIEQALDDVSITALHQVCHALVSSHCAEAWGLSISEAMSQGNPAIATGFSGNMEYMSEDNAYPVAYTIRNLTETEVAFAPELFSEHMSWAQIDEEGLYEKMLTCFLANDKDELLRRAAAITDRFGVEALTSLFASRLEDLMSRPATTSVRPGLGPAGEGKQKKRGKGPISRVGMFHEMPEDYSVIVGRQVAVDQFALGLARHGAKHTYELYCPPMQVPAIRQSVEAGAGRVSAHDRQILAKGFNGFDFTAWHDSQFETYRPFALRDHVKGSYPVTIVHHSLSYKELLHERLLRLLLAKPYSYDSIVCTSTSSRQTMSALIDHVTESFNASYGTRLSYRGRLDVIPFGVDAEFFRPRDKAAVREHFQLSHDAFIMLWVGRLSAVDKADLLPLVQTLAQLCHANPSRELLLVCAGCQRPGERFGDMIREFTQKLGVTEQVLIFDDLHEGIHLLYAAADVFVSPADNLQESFGLSPVEAMACGVPQVVSDWNGYRDTVVQGKTGFLVPTYTGSCSDDISGAAFLTDSTFEHLVLSQSVVVDPGALQNAIQRLIDGTELRAKMSEASRQRVLDNYSWQTVIAQYEALWSELSVLAQQAPERSETDQGYSMPPYAQAFAHYPSEILPEVVHVGVTSAGHRLMAGELGLPLYCAHRWQYLDVDIIKRVLNGVGQMDTRGKTLSVRRILSVITKNGQAPVSREVVFRHVLWLLKYGFIERLDRTSQVSKEVGK